MPRSRNLMSRALSFAAHPGGAIAWRLEEFRFRHAASPAASHARDASLESIAKFLDDWVASHGTQGFVPGDFIPDTEASYDHGIQQVRGEILDFVSVLLKKNLHGNALEIGLGKYGGTHMLWRHIFRKVVTVEFNYEVINRFRNRELLDSRSLIIAGSSFDSVVREKVSRVLKDGVDLLFIDGDHEYEAVIRDWDAFHHLVNPGGVIAFHDSLSNQPHHGVDVFLKNMAKGMFGPRYDPQTIAHSQQIGISYIVC